MMAPSLTQRARRLRRALRSPRAAELTPRARILAEAVWNLPAEQAEHSWCQAKLPTCAIAELEHQRPHIEPSSVLQHLLVCADCESVYSDLIEIMRADLEDRLPVVIPPAPDLSFLGAPHE